MMGDLYKASMEHANEQNERLRSREDIDLVTKVTGVDTRGRISLRGIDARVQVVFPKGSWRSTLEMDAYLQGLRALEGADVRYRSKVVCAGEDYDELQRLDVLTGAYAGSVWESANTNSSPQARFPPPE